MQFVLLQLDSFLLQVCAFYKINILGFVIYASNRVSTMNGFQVLKNYIDPMGESCAGCIKMLIHIYIQAFSGLPIFNPF
jgi:hypothetical protein